NVHLVSGLEGEKAEQRAIRTGGLPAHKGLKREGGPSAGLRPGLSEPVVPDSRPFTHHEYGYGRPTGYRCWPLGGSCLESTCRCAQSMGARIYGRGVFLRKPTAFVGSFCFLSCGLPQIYIMNDQMKLKRSSGILMHITSLPSPYGIGDLGATAYQFVDFLQESGHHYWQILPINPTEEALGHSPYSSFSAFAGNPLLISPQMLVEEGFLSKEDLYIVPSFDEQKVEFDAVSSFKAVILQRAYTNFLKKEKQFIVPYSEFREQNEHWLEDYALYLALKDKDNSSWTEWPEPIRDRDPETLRELRQALAQGIKREKIIQFLFFTQWQK